MLASPKCAPRTRDARSVSRPVYSGSWQPRASACTRRQSHPRLPGLVAYGPSPTGVAPFRKLRTSARTHHHDFHFMGRVSTLKGQVCAQVAVVFGYEPRLSFDSSLEMETL